MTETKAELMAAVQKEWDNLQASLDGLTEEQMHLPGVVGDWSIKDVLAHITAWQARLITSMFRAEKGLTPDTTESGPAVDRFNQQWYIEMKDRPFEQVWDDLDASYHQILKRLEVSHAEALFDPRHYKWMKGQPFVQYIEGDTSEHYAEHAAQIREWRKRLADEQSSSGGDQ